VNPIGTIVISAPEMKGYTPIFRFGQHAADPTAVNNSPDMLFRHGYRRIR